MLYARGCSRSSVCRATDLLKCRRLGGNLQLCCGSDQMALPSGLNSRRRPVRAPVVQPGPYKVALPSRLDPGRACSAKRSAQPATRPVAEECRLYQHSRSVVRGRWVGHNKAKVRKMRAASRGLKAQCGPFLTASNPSLSDTGSRWPDRRSSASGGPPTRSLAQPPAWGGPRRPCPRPGGVDRVRATT